MKNLFLRFPCSYDVKVKLSRCVSNLKMAAAVFGSYLFQTLLWISLFYLIRCDCRFPSKRISNGYIVYQSPKDARKGRAPELYVLQFKCSNGYERVGRRFIQCLEGRWTNVVPICRKMHCSDPPNVENADLEIQGETPGSLYIGTLVTYSCKEGYELKDPFTSIIACVLDPEVNQAAWMGKVPFCQEKKKCRDPGVSTFGRREGECCFPGDVLRFTCLENYEIVGKEEITCFSSGNWSTGRPLCKPLNVHCELPPDIPHGVVIGGKAGDYFLPYDEAEILCEPGYRHNGHSEFIMCEEEGNWEDEFGECTEIFCDLPEEPVNGMIQELQNVNHTSFPYNFEINYGCNDGYRLLGGDSWRFCGKNGWSGTTPRCEETRCPNPGMPEYGDREGDDFHIGAKVRFKCFTGYDLLGSVERYCMPNGQWTGELARCNTPGNYCPNPGIPINGFKTGYSYGIGEKVGFRCQPGYIHIGSEVRRCLMNRTWTGTETKCLSPYDFDNTAQISEILKSKLRNKFEEEKKELKRYDEAYEGRLRAKGIYALGKMLDLNYQGILVIHFAFDVSGSVGEFHFNRSIEFAKAILRKVGISEKGPLASATIFNSKAEKIFFPMQVKTLEEVFLRLDGIEYTGGGTSASSALAQVKDIILTEDNYLDKNNKKDVVFIMTDGKANMGGNPEKEAKSLKDGGVDIYCIGITGDPRIDTLYKIASSSKYGNEERPNVFILQNYTSMSFLIDAITNEKVDYSQCGLGMDHVITENQDKNSDGEKSTKPWSWMASLFFLPFKAKSPNEAELKCGGSIINKNFILTAAHCMYEVQGNERIRLRDKSEIIVKLGLTNIKDETTVQDFGVKMIYIHEMFNPGTVNERLYDYDIALLQIDRPVEYGPLSRPVCLPPAVLPVNSSLYSSNEFSWAIGWGHNKVVNPHDRFVHYTITQNLKELRLPIQSNERCLKSMEDMKFDKKYFTNRMFCAGDGKTGNDTCQGDSGGPLMQVQMNSDGFLFWTQVGIVSWGIGCGVEKTYGFYTNVQNLRSWIDEKTKSIS